MTEADIYYYITPKSIKGIDSDSKIAGFSDVDPSTLETTHKKVCTIRVKYKGKEALDFIFRLFNGQDNPLGIPEKQDYIKKCRLHTSMSIGDVVVMNGEMWVCKFQGWERL